MNQKVLLGIVAAAAPILTAVVGIMHERNVGAERQARRDEALLAALMDCVKLRELHTGVAPSIDPDGALAMPAPPAPAPMVIPPAAGPGAAKPDVMYQMPSESVSALEGEPASATRILDSIAINHGWKK